MTDKEQQEELQAHRSALASERAWWEMGSHLIQASDLIWSSIEASDFGPHLIVGGPAAATVEPGGFGDVWRRKLIAEMLYAFGVENWLKGLLVAKLPRTSQQIKERIRAKIDAALLPLATEDDLIPHLLAAANSEEIASDLQELNARSYTEDEERASAALKHNHDLGRLARAVGLYISPEMLHYLDALYAINQLGRYPALTPTSVRKLWTNDLQPYVGNLALKAELNAAIKAAHGALTVAEFTAVMQQQPG